MDKTCFNCTRFNPKDKTCSECLTDLHSDHKYWTDQPIIKEDVLT